MIPVEFEYDSVASLGYDTCWWCEGVSEDYDLNVIEAALLCQPSVLQSKFVEVKGPRDTLMARQVAWLHILVKATAQTESICSVEVCHVEERAWASAKSLRMKTKRKKKKTSKKRKKTDENL